MMAGSASFPEGPDDAMHVKTEMRSVALMKLFLSVSFYNDIESMFALTFRVLDSAFRMISSGYPQFFRMDMAFLVYSTPGVSL